MNTTSDQEQKPLRYYHRRHEYDETGFIPFLKEEKVLTFRGRDVLYFFSVIRKPIPNGPKQFIVVPGYILETKTGEHGSRVSTIEPIRDQAERNKLEEIIKNSGYKDPISFW